MVWARPSLTDRREKLECRSLKAIAHQGYGHMLAAPPGGSAVCCLPLLLQTQCGLPRLEKAFLNMGVKGGRQQEGLRG